MAETESKWVSRMNKKESTMLENGLLKKEFSFSEIFPTKFDLEKKQRDA